MAIFNTSARFRLIFSVVTCSIIISFFGFLYQRNSSIRLKNGFSSASHQDLEDLAKDSRPLPPYIVPARPTEALDAPSAQSVSFQNQTRTLLPSVSNADDYGLEDAQCDSVFPYMYYEIDRAKAHWQSRRNLTNQDTEIPPSVTGWVRTMIYNRQLYIIEAKYNGDGYDIRRSLAVLSSIYRAVIAFHGPIPNIEFTFSVNDTPDPEHTGRPLWTLARREEVTHQWLMPDFGYWAWDMDLVGSYPQVRDEMAEVETDFQNKISVAFWRGANNNHVRTDLLKVSNGKLWADVQEIVWKQGWFRRHHENNLVRMADHCKYKYLIQTEGATYSGRGKYLLNCNSITLVHKRDWVQHTHHLFIAQGEGQNVVEVERDFSDLPMKIERLSSDTQAAQRIANNSVGMFRDRYLTPAAQACYWRKLFRSWRDVSWEPELRGIPYETYLLTAWNERLPKCGWLWKKLKFC